MSNKRRHAELLAEVKEKFGARIGSGEGKIPVTQAARILNVSRQTVHRYLAGLVMPRADVLMAAFRAWGLVLHYRGIDVTVASARPGEQIHAVPPIQLGLFDLVDDLRERDIEVKIGSKSVDGLDLSVKLKFSA